MIPRLKPYYNHRELIAALSFFRNDSVREYQHKFAELFNTKTALAFSYGRSALYTIFKALEFENKEIIVPAYTCVVVANAIVISGNIPRFVDISLDDYNMNLDLLAAKINKNTAAVVATHLFGYPLNTDKLKDIVSSAEKRLGHKIWIIQDCAHSFGTRWNGKLVCKQGDVAIYGLNISKMISSIFGGMLTTDDDRLAKKIRLYQDQKFTKSSVIKTIKRLLYLISIRIAFQNNIYRIVNFLEEETSIIKSLTNYYQEDKIDLPYDFLENMLEIEARVGIEQLKKYSKIIDLRHRIAQYYSKNLSGLNGIILPPIIEGSTYSHYVPRVNDRQKLLLKMRKQGIQLGWLIEYSIPEMKAFRQWKEGEFINSRICSKTTINLPNWPGMKKKNLEKISSGINLYYK